MKKPENCKQAASQGAYIDDLRKRWPFRIIANGGYEAVLCGGQPLLPGCAPIYRFPGGPVVMCERELTNIIEW